MTTTTSTSPSTTHTSRLRHLPVALLAFVAYVPLLFTAPGEVSADTKAFLLLDPSRALSRAPYMWNTHVDAGTVTHQNIGYLFPLGPWYWVFRTLGVPTWIAERLWFGTLLMLAGAGTLWMLRRFGMRGWAPVAGAFVYMLSPYVLAYMGRTSIILTPWAMLPWLIGLMLVALRERTWRAPVLFALAVTFMAGTNASSVIFVLIAPALLLPFAIKVTHDTDLRSAFRTVVRIAVATIPAQLWWAAGLLVQGRFGLPILQLTETVETVAQTSTAAEGLRGLGYWYFYGKDGLTSWTESGPLYTTTLVMLVVSFMLPTLALIGAVITRWTWRAYFVIVMLVGLVIAVGTYPYHDPAPVGSVIKGVMSLQAGFALRNSPRAIPLVAIASAALIACLCDALAPAIARRVGGERGRRVALALPIGVIAIAILNLPPLWTGGFVQSDMKFPETLPSYWTDAAAWLDANDTGRVLELPGADFGAYRWGETQDPVTPGIIDRDWVGRELTAYGSPATVDLLRALDARFQEGVGDPAAVADIARLLGASDVLLRLDSQYERYHGARPADLWELFGAGSAANGLGAPITFGDPTIAVADPRQPTIDEAELARGQVATPPLAVLPVDGARAEVRAESTNNPTIVWGDGQGIVNAAGAGLLTRDHAIFYAATMNASTRLTSLLRPTQPTLIVTDTNRKRAQRWGTTRENDGATETPTSVALVDDPKDTRLDLFPGEASTDQSVAWYGSDVSDVRATSYGNIVAYSAEVRPVNAIDGDSRTAWTTGGYSEVVGDRIQIDYTRPITADHIDLLQTQGNRFITKVTVLLDGVPATTVDMTDASFVGQGQRVDLGGVRTFQRLDVRIDDANVKGLPNFVGISNVGFREITVPGVSAQEWIVTPSAGLDQFATTPATFLFTRLRSNPIEAYRQDPELAIRRIFTVVAPASYALGGTARLNAGSDSALVDRLLGRPGLSDGSPIVNGTRYLGGALPDRPSSAVDGDPNTAWVTPFGGQVGASFSITNPTRFTTRSLNLSFLDDGLHSTPTRLTLTTDEGASVTVDVPSSGVGTDGVRHERITLPGEGISGRTLEVTIAGEREVTTKEYFGGGQHAFPIAIVDLGGPVTLAPVPTNLPATCRNDLVTVDGTAIPVRMSGTTADAVARAALTLTQCDSPVVNLASGTHRLAAATGLDTGVDIDRVGVYPATTPPEQRGAYSPTTAPTTTRVADSTPNLDWKQTGELSYRVQVPAGSTPFWLVLGQSLSAGWNARVVGGSSLGAPTLIDGFANGWYVEPGSGPMTIEISWTPQRTVWIALALSALWFAGLLIASIVFVIRRRRGSASDDAGATARLRSLRRIAPSKSNRSYLAIGAALSVGALLIGGLGVGIAMAAWCAIAIASRRTTLAALVAAVGSVAAIVVLYVGLQWHRHYPLGVEWPSGFWIAPQLGFFAVLVVAAETLLRAWNGHGSSQVGGVASSTGDGARPEEDPRPEEH